LDCLRDPARCTDSFRSALETHFFCNAVGTSIALEALRDVLYKSTTTTTSCNLNYANPKPNPNPDQVSGSGPDFRPA